MSVSINGTGSITGIDQGFNITSGSVGVGTTNPRTDLQVGAFGGGDSNIQLATGTSGASNILFGDGSAGSDYYKGFIKYNHSTDNLELYTTDDIIQYTGGSERLRITSAGKVGIGTDDPKQFLAVVGRATFDQRGDYYGAWINGDSDADSSFNVGAWYNVGGRLRDNGNHVVLESMNTSHYVQLQPSGGNVGVGEAGPNVSLHVTKDNDVSYTPDQATQNSNNQIKIENHSTTADSFVSMAMRSRACDFHLGVKNDGDTNAGRLFLVHQDTTNKEVVSVTSGGLVGIDVTNPATNLDVNGILQLRASGNTTYATRIYSRLDSTHCSVIESYLNSNTAFEMMGSYADGGGANPRIVIGATGKNVGINETSPDTNLHISRSSSQNDTHGILKVESTNTSTGAQTNAGIIVKNRYGWAQFMQWEDHGLRIGSRSTSTGGEGKVTVTYGSDSTGAVINENGVVTMPQQCGFHVVMHATQTPNNNEMVNLWDTDASDSRSYIKNCTFNAGRFQAPVAGLYYFTAQLLLMNVASNDDNIHLAWTKGSNNDTFAYWNTRHDGASANGSYGYSGYLPVIGSTTVYLAANEIFGIRITYTGDIDVYGTDKNWGHWSGFLVG